MTVDWAEINLTSQKQLDIVGPMYYYALKLTECVVGVKQSENFLGMLDLRYLAMR